MKRSGVLLAGLAAALLLAWVGWSREHATVLEQAVASELEAVGAEEGAGNKPVPVAGVPAATISGAGAGVVPDAPLPPAGAALTEHYDELAGRAARGEIAAAQRLYDDLQRCHFWHYGRVIRIGSPRATGPNLAPGMDDTRRTMVVDHWLAEQARLCQLERQCRGVTAEQAGDRLRWLLRAAELGDVDARLELMQGAPLLQLARWQDLDHLPHIRRMTVPWLEQAVAAGHARAFELFGTLLAVPDHGRQPLGADLVAHDPERAYALLHASTRAAGFMQLNRHQQAQRQDALRRLEARLQPEQVALARARGEQEYQRLRSALDRSSQAERPDWLGTRMRTPAEIAGMAPECLQSQ